MIVIMVPVLFCSLLNMVNILTKDSGHMAVFICDHVTFLKEILLQVVCMVVILYNILVGIVMIMTSETLYTEK